MSRLLINEPPIVFSPSLAALIGTNEAIALQQIHYYVEISNNLHDGCRWVYNSVTKWKINHFPFWSESTVKRTLLNLEKSGLLITGNYNKDSRDRSKWYTIDYAKLNELENNDKDKDEENALGQNDLMDDVKMTQPLPKTTTNINNKNQQKISSDDSKPAKQVSRNRQSKIPYQEIIQAFNEAVGDTLPNAETLNDKRKRAISKFWKELKEPSLEAVKNYFGYFMETATPWYFGENDRGWRANFDYLLRPDTITKTREGSL
ncbi:replication protein RepO [Arsenophonus sp. aPb]|uniref:replication protein RepO n=1 Tax=Arsenophonus sp. aPb TaxID=3041619 RepID=UPI0024690CDD|nr:replication protein RepO [Arsenophonus sp. aPb]WGL99139.1 replication protein RepO [Arsenophonus sp. aPb]